VIDLLSGKKASSLTNQLTHVWDMFHDKSTGLSVKDPANEGNDLSSLLNAGVKSQLSIAARAALSTVKASGWEGVFGKLEDSDSGGANQKKLQAAVTAVSTGTKPWAE